MTTTSSPVTEPSNLKVLRRRIRDVATATSVPERRLNALIGNTVVGQLMPEGMVKGGTGMKLRFGDQLTRDTPDLDTAFRGDRAAYIAKLRVNLESGWGGFSGTVLLGRQRDPQRVGDRFSAAYVMQPASVKLAYRNKPFCTVTLEIGHDELEATTTSPDDEIELVISAEHKILFAKLGLPEPQPIPVLPVHHQVAQKLHACTEPGSQRAHDLVDLRLLVPMTTKQLVATTAKRLFDYRHGHAWPPKVEAADNWNTLYADAAEGLPVLNTVTEAVDWLNRYIQNLP